MTELTAEVFAQQCNALYASCRQRGCTPKQALAFQAYHHLSLLHRNGHASADDSLARLQDSNFRHILQAVFGALSPHYCDILLRLSDDPIFAHQVKTMYHEEVLPGFDRESS
ncbi:hypothetical protein ACFL0V_03870 [Nanoarchaeota archaeon]